MPTKVQDRRRPGRTRPRRSQAERVETMRGRLLDATIELLVERGWANLSTNDVIHRARVSRGALTHHFPSKAALMEAAAHRLLDQQAAEFEIAFRSLEPAARTVEGAIDLLWSYFQGPAFAAFVELIVAARTNRELREVLADAPARITAAAFEVFAELFPDAAATPHAEQALRAAFAVMTGMALEEMISEGPAPRNSDLLTAMKFVARRVLAG